MTLVHGRPRRRARRRALGLLGVALAIGGWAAGAPRAAAMQAPPAADPDWSARISDVPMADLGGRWLFRAEASDPMVEVWATVPIEYRIDQQPDRIRLDFIPEGGQPTRQAYRWDGSVRESQRPGAEVRERAVWTDGGRTFEIEGRWWPVDDLLDVRRYSLRYRLEGRDLLIFEQINAHGTTTWRFARAR